MEPGSFWGGSERSWDPSFQLLGSQQAALDRGSHCPGAAGLQPKHGTGVRGWRQAMLSGWKRILQR